MIYLMLKEIVLPISSAIAGLKTMEVFEKKITAEVNAFYYRIGMFMYLKIDFRLSPKDQRPDTRESKLQTLTCHTLTYRRIMCQMRKNNKYFPSFNSIYLMF